MFDYCGLTRLVRYLEAKESDRITVKKGSRLNRNIVTIMQQIEPDPLWDEGISSYLHGEYEKKQGPLTIDDLQGFACDRAVRIGDLLETLFLMAIYGAWAYCDEHGKEQKLDAFALDDLYAKGRIGPDDLKDFQGVWSPVK